MRPPAVAGTFYPADPAELEADGARRAGRRRWPGARPTTTGLRRTRWSCPTPGYVYSGPIAASAYARVLPRRGRGHPGRAARPRPPGAARGPWRCRASTPSPPRSATVPIDADGPRIALVGRPGVVVDDRAHADEHSLEVHLPFLQVVLGDGWSLVPLVVGQAPAADGRRRCSSCCGAGPRPWSWSAPT